MNEDTFKLDNFIGIYNDVYPEGYCEHLVSEFERLKNGGAGSNRLVSEDAKPHVKDDFQVSLNLKSYTTAAPFNGHDAVDVFFDGLQACYNEYIKKYSVLANEQIVADCIKIQKTSPGGGYHVWHSEQGPGRFATRVLVYALYLNDIKETDAGETEFLYQQLRVRPEKNKMVVWPAAFTHAHRGNTLFGDTDKYIVTGWFYYNEV